MTKPPRTFWEDLGKDLVDPELWYLYTVIADELAEQLRDDPSAENATATITVRPTGPPDTIEVYANGTWIVNGKRWTWWRNLWWTIRAELRRYR